MRLSEKLSFPIEKTPFFSRPLSLLCAVFLLSVFFIFISFWAFLIFAAAVCAVTVMLLIIYRPKRLMAILILSSVLLGGAVSAGRVYRYEVLDGLFGERKICAVVYTEYYAEEFGSCYELKIKSVDGKRYNIKVSAYFDHDPDFSVYDTVYMSGKIEHGISSALIGKSIEITEGRVHSITNEAKRGPEYGLYLLRQKTAERLDTLLRHNTAAYAKALFLGDKSSLATSFTVNMSALGISHILAVSGMHMSVISLIVTYLLDRFKRARKTKCVVISIAAFLFMAVAGFSPSVTRAGIMLIISSFAVFCGGRSDSLTSLMLSGAIICFIAPENAISASFLLSFFATLGIVFCALYAERAARRRMYSSRVGDLKTVYAVVRYFAFSILVTLCAVLFTVPVMSLFFSETSFFAIVTNIFAIPVATLSMVLTLLCLAFGSIPFAGEMLCTLFDFIYHIFELAVTYLARNFHTSVSLRYPFFALILILLFSSFVYMWIRRVKSPTPVLSAFLVAALLFTSGVQIYSLYRKDDTCLTYYADGNSDGLLLQSGSISAYIDIGSGSKALVIEGITDAFEKNYETELDAFVITHYHSAHIGTIMNITRAYRISVFYLPKPETDKEKQFYNEIIKHIGYSDAVVYERGSAIKLGNAEINTVPLSFIERSDHPVIALQVRTKNKGVTYLGASFSESAALYIAEGLVAESSAVICGTHGPAVKEQIPYLCFEKGKEVYLSPYEQTDESKVFPEGRYIFSEADFSGVARLTLDLSG